MGSVCSVGIMSAGIMGAGIMRAGIMGAGILGIGILCAEIVGAGIVCAGIMGAGVIDVWVIGAGMMCAGTMGVGVMESWAGARRSWAVGCCCCRMPDGTRFLHSHFHSSSSNKHKQIITTNKQTKKEGLAQSAKTSSIIKIKIFGKFFSKDL